MATCSTTFPTKNALVWDTAVDISRPGNTAAVSGDGLTFSGNGINAAGLNDIWVATVPTPGALILGSFGTLLAIRRRR